ncbi:MAG: HAMP domain-containing sensor histidine kinase [Ruthenibacterium sp.]
MKKRKMTLRLKLTCVSVCVMTLMCFALTAVSLSASSLLTDAALILPAQSAVPGTTQAQMPAQALEMPVETTRAQRAFNLISVSAMLLIIVSGSACVYFYVKKELRPLEALSEQVQRLDAEHLSIPLVVHATGDEIEQLSAAISDMAVRVNDAYVMQKSFSSSAAHELRTPLAAMQSKIEVFRMKKERSMPEYAGLVDALSRNTQRLSDLVQELLELTNQAVMNMTQQVNLRALAEEAALDLEPLAEEKQVRILVEGQASTVGNDCLLQRAVFNLMQNAVKYNVAGGTVAVSMGQRASKVWLCVADTGIGIPQERKEHVFELFFCVDPSRSREMGGNGLGLAIVKRILTQHGGSIAVKDNQPQGTRMEMVLDAVSFKDDARSDPE